MKKLLLNILSIILFALGIFSVLCGLLIINQGGIPLVIIGIIIFLFGFYCRRQIKSFNKEKRTSKSERPPEVKPSKPNDLTVTKSTNSIIKVTTEKRSVDNGTLLSEYLFIDSELYWVAYKYSDVEIYIADPLSVTLYENLSLKQEPDNPADEHAVALCNNNDKVVGYLYRKGNLQSMANDFIDRNEPIKCLVSKIDNGKIYIDLYFYRLRKFLFPEESLTVKLTGNKNSEMQENISLLSEGDEIEVALNYENDKYLVTESGAGIGYIPNSKSELFSEKENKGYMIGGNVVSIVLNDNGKYDVTVNIVFD